MLKRVRVKFIRKVVKDLAKSYNVTLFSYSATSPGVSRYHGYSGNIKYVESPAVASGYIKAVPTDELNDDDIFVFDLTSKPLDLTDIVLSYDGVQNGGNPIRAAIYKTPSRNLINVQKFYNVTHSVTLDGMSYICIKHFDKIEIERIVPASKSTTPPVYFSNNIKDIVLAEFNQLRKKFSSAGGDTTDTPDNPLLATYFSNPMLKDALVEEFNILNNELRVTREELIKYVRDNKIEDDEYFNIPEDKYNSETTIADNIRRNKRYVLVYSDWYDKHMSKNSLENWMDYIKIYFMPYLYVDELKAIIERIKGYSKVEYKEELVPTMAYNILSLYYDGYIEVGKNDITFLREYIVNKSNVVTVQLMLKDMSCNVGNYTKETLKTAYNNAIKHDDETNILFLNNMIFKHHRGNDHIVIPGRDRSDEDLYNSVFKYI